MTKTRAFLRKSFKKWWGDGSVAQRKSAEKLAWLAWIQGSGAAHPQASSLGDADQAEEPSLADVDELCAEFGFHYEDGESLEILQQVITAAITHWRPVAQPAAKPVDLTALRDPDFSDGLTAAQHLDVLPPDPDVDHILALAAIIRKVDGKHDLGAAALAEAILAHPGFSGCHDGPVGVQSAFADLLSQVKSCDGTAQINTEWDGYKMRVEPPQVGYHPRDTHWQPLPSPPITLNPHA
jgi:hypothetical protein